MTTDTKKLTEEWARLEGWKLVLVEKFSEDNCHYVWHQNGREIWGFAQLPNWTEPNRFFAEVVPRMTELGFSPYIGGGRNQWLRHLDCPLDKNWCAVNLNAAIQARKELGK